MSVLRTPEDVVNYAIHRIGRSERVDNLLNGTRLSQVALDSYGQTRDHLLYSGNWDFSQRTVQGTLLKESPTHPPSYIVTPWTPAYPALPWNYEYLYPSGCLKVRTIKRQPVLIPDYDPRYNVFSVDNDIGYSPPRKVILTNVPNAIIVYCGSITDPSSWNDGFLEVLADELGKALAPVLMNIDAFKVSGAEEQQDTAIAEYNKERG